MNFNTLSGWRVFYRRYGAYAAVGTTVVVFLMIGFFVVKPKIEEILTIRTSLSEGQMKLDRLQEKINDIIGVANDESHLSDSLSQMEAALPSTKDVAGLLFGFERLAQDSSLSAKSVQVAPGLVAPKSNNSSTQVGEMLFQASLEGSFPDVQLFLAKMRNARRLIMPKSLTITASTRTDGLVSITAPLVTYFLPPPKNLAQVSSPLPKLSKADEDTIQTISQFPAYTVLPRSVGSTNQDPFFRP